MTSNQPHIQEVGAFNPIEAFTHTFASLARMLAGLRDDPQAIPPQEILRAATITVDLLEAITQLSTTSLMQGVASVVDHEAFINGRAEYIATRMARSPEEEIEYRSRLMRKVSQFIPHELAFDGPVDDDDSSD